MNSERSSYRSSLGRRALADVYTDAVGQFGIDVDERYVEARHGDTHVL